MKVYLKALAITLGVILGITIIFLSAEFVGIGLVYLLIQFLITYGSYLPHIPNEAGPYIAYGIMGGMFIWIIITGAYAVRRDGLDKNGKMIPFKHWGYWGDGKWDGKVWRNGEWK